MYKTIKETREALKSGAITSVALVESSVKTFEEDKDKMVAAYIKKLAAQGQEIHVKDDNRIQIVD